MTSRIAAINFTCRNHERSLAFWSNVLDFVPDPVNPNEPGDEVSVLIHPTAPIEFLMQPADGTFEPRVHLDLIPTDRTRDEEVERLLGLGSNIVADRRKADGSGWVTMADPDGYSFCVERSEPEKQPTPES